MKGTWLGDYGEDIFFDSCPGSAGAVLFTKPPFSEGFIPTSLPRPESRLTKGGTELKGKGKV
ncbi:MAG: hypothetical protein P1P67_10905 [Treponema phagedenis]|uniref:hypothetical protein n=1 Tax=Treponema phagedenis TaxID=162 RepID=UPI0011E69C91|nr:hypothetical protein [Treponema phagedenis]QEK02646.1 hypothetical protein FUT83_01710 [Treponema phagedenis]QEK08273.1 hypothetical protein FUT81_01690 [Treponema phagedenis]